MEFSKLLYRGFGNFFSYRRVRTHQSRICPRTASAVLQQNNLFKRNHPGELIEVLVNRISSTTTFADRLQSEYAQEVLFTVSYTDFYLEGRGPNRAGLKHTMETLAMEIDQLEPVSPNGAIKHNCRRKGRRCRWRTMAR